MILGLNTHSFVNLPAEEQEKLLKEYGSQQAAAGNRNYTVLTVEKLARENPGAQLYLAIGSDMPVSYTHLDVYKRQ